MPGGSRCFVQVIATNGYHTVVATTPVFHLPVGPPKLLLGPLDGPVLFAQGFSFEHGPLLGKPIEWSVDGRVVGYGGTFDTRKRAKGQYFLTVSVTAPDGGKVKQDLGFYDGGSGRLVMKGKFF